MDTSSMNAGELSTKRSRSNSEQDNSDSIKSSVKQRKVTIDVCDEIGAKSSRQEIHISMHACGFFLFLILLAIIGIITVSLTSLKGEGYQFTPYCVDVGDFNGDNRIDIVVVNYGSDTVGVLLGYGDGLESRVHSAVIGDLKNDQKLDLTVTNYGLDSIGVLIGNGDGSFGNFTTYSTGFESQSYLVALGDFNNDQFLDIVATNENADSIYIFLGYGNGTFQNAATYLNQLLSYPSWVAIGDFSNDNISDIIVSSS
ncbi:unnamed protein product [Rotaria magnacalcarata]|uniref:Uncharacterized protein n=1 Tax=Rotaria magnacalcarata TaxID=392030 RepID=A0A820EYR0_9BILA|nr:unnamed protein product [Rotaria magnacalcarata]CAF4253814.1 unnamed protein product [Rotaria magnacalcarata]